MSIALAIAVLASGCALFATSVPAEWTLREPPEGLVLELRVGIGRPCNELEAVNVDETDDAVTIDILVRVASGSCDDSFGTRHVDVELDEPLGDRDLRGCAVDGDEVIRVRAVGDRDCRVVSE